MKVFHVIDSGGLYGAEVMLLALMQEQERMGIEAELISIGTKGCAEKPLEAEARRRGLQVDPIRMTAGPNVWGAYRIVQMIHRKGGDLLHSHGYKGNILFGLMPYLIRRLPVVTTLHGWTSSPASKNKKMRLYEWLDAKSLCRVERLVLVDEAMQQHPRLKKLAATCNVINNGIPVVSADEDPASLPTLPDGRVADFIRKGQTLCAIGRLSPEKGFTSLIEAFQQIAGNEPEARLLILGEGKEREALEGQIKRYGLVDRVLLPGYRDRAADYLAHCEFLVMPSLTEGLPITALEAMRAGIPILASRVGGLPQVLENGRCGVLVEAGNAEKLAEGMRALLKSSALRQELAEKAKRRLQAEYSASAMAEKYAELYAEVLHNDGRLSQPA